MREYDDARYLQWVRELENLVEEFLDTEGNTEDSLRDEIDNAIENVRED
jgi:hypothetical protein